MLFMDSILFFLLIYFSKLGVPIFLCFFVLHHDDVINNVCYIRLRTSTQPTFLHASVLVQKIWTKFHTPTRPLLHTTPWWNLDESFSHRATHNAKHTYSGEREHLQPIYGRIDTRVCTYSMYMMSDERVSDGIIFSTFCHSYVTTFM